MNNPGPVLYGKCKIPGIGRAEADGHEVISCPSCGQTNRLEDAIREAAERHAHKVISGMFSGLSGSGITVKSPPQRDYRWITDV